MNFPDWIAIDDLKLLFGVLAQKGDSRLVGGCVRNIVLENGVPKTVQELGRRPEGSERIVPFTHDESQLFEVRSPQSMKSEGHITDIDVATEVFPHDVIDLLKRNGIKCIPTGLDHGTVTALLNGIHYEITTLRKDIDTNGRRAKIEFTDQWELDAERRDFTINAMYADLFGKIYDYFNGQEDLKKRLVKFVNDPETRIKEDYLRILRYFRFYSYFGGDNIDKPSFDGCRKLAEGINKLSGERITAEMLKILSSTFVMPTLKLMQESGILSVLGLQPSGNTHYILQNDSIVNLAVLIRDTAKPEDTLSKIKARWRLSNQMSDQIEFMIYLPFILPQDEATQSKYLYKYGLKNYINGLKLWACEHPDTLVQSLLDRAKTLEVPKFPITGNDLIRLGYAGKEIGLVKDKLKERWVESKFTLTREQLLQ